MELIEISNYFDFINNYSLAVMFVALLSLLFIKRYKEE